MSRTQNAEWNKSYEVQGGVIGRRRAFGAEGPGGAKYGWGA